MKEILQNSYMFSPCLTVRPVVLSAVNIHIVVYWVTKQCTTVGWY
jgi:hypothetical protein